MSYPIDKKLVIAVSSSALFDLADSHRVFLERGIEEYRRHQEEHLDTPFGHGVAFPFIRRFLYLNEVFSEEQPVEVVLLSRNSPETGLRIFRSIEHYGLDISRAVFMGGASPHSYLAAFNAALFLSANEEDVQNAIEEGLPAGVVLPGNTTDKPDDAELRVAFDFDGVIADDEAETVYKESGDLDRVMEHEQQKQHIPHRPGPLADLFRGLARLQQLENKKAEENAHYKKVIRVAIVTARNAPAHERVITTLKDWGVSLDEAFFLGGMEKARVLKVLKPHLFFDDQRRHLSASAADTPMVHVPFGIANKPI